MNHRIEEHISLLYTAISFERIEDVFLVSVGALSCPLNLRASVRAAYPVSLNAASFPLTSKLFGSIFLLQNLPAE